MKLRYRKIENIYIPQYSNDGEKWNTFKEHQIDGDLRKLCCRIGDLQLHDKFSSCGQWFYASTKEVMFTTELFCMAFLGASKSRFKEELKNFDLEIS